MSNNHARVSAKRSAFVLAALLGVSAALPLAAQEKPGRYTMTPADGGFIRLDTETGAMSICARKGEGWSCEAMPDSVATLNRDLQRLEAENKALKDEIRRMEEAFGLGEPGKKAEAPSLPAPDQKPGGKLQLPSEKDVDQAMDYLTRMLRKFREKLKELESERAPGTPL